MATRASDLPHHRISCNFHFLLRAPAFVLVMLPPSPQHWTSRPLHTCLLSLRGGSSCLFLNHIWKHFYVLNLNVFHSVPILLPPPVSLSPPSPTPAPSCGAEDRVQRCEYPKQSFYCFFFYLFMCVGSGSAVTGVCRHPAFDTGAWIWILVLMVVQQRFLTQGPSL